MQELIESFLFIMMVISPAVVGIPLQVMVTRKKEKLSWFYLVNCIIASGVQLIFVISYTFYVANLDSQRAQAIGWLLVIYVFICIFLVGINSLIILLAHFITKWVMKRKNNKIVEV